MKLDLRVFFFDARRDYLPYYKKFSIEIDLNKNLREILPIIKELCRDFDYPENKLYFRVNSFVTDGLITIKEIVKRLGKELTIEPLSKYRCMNDLIIEDSDFNESYTMLESFCNSEDRDYFNKLYGVHYASATFEYNKQYIGDAVLLLACRLIFNKHPKKDEILDIISSDNGLWDAEWENNLLDNTSYKESIELLKNLAKPKKDKNRVSSLFTRKYKESILNKDDGIGIAFYYGQESKELFELSNGALSSGYRDIAYLHAHKSCGINLLETNEELALIKASRVLLDAYDSGASLILCDAKYSNYFKKNIGKIEKVSKRSIFINIQDIDNFSI